METAKEEYRRKGVEVPEGWQGERFEAKLEKREVEHSGEQAAK